MKEGAFSSRNDRSFDFALIGNVLADPKTNLSVPISSHSLPAAIFGGLFSVK
jgi:hypothetical protein